MKFRELRRIFCDFGRFDGYFRQVWNALRRQQDAVSQRFSKFQGPIEVPQVESLLSELNDGVPPPPSEVAWVIDRVDPHGRGFIEPEELRAAVALWYYRLALPDD